MKAYVVQFDPICDCGCRSIVMITLDEKKAKDYVESKGKYSDYEYKEFELDEEN